jgi:hypothetical protein
MRSKPPLPLAEEGWGEGMLVQRVGLGRSAPIALTALRAASPAGGKGEMRVASSFAVERSLRGFEPP